MNEETQVAQTETATETTGEKQPEKTGDASVATDTEKSKELETALAQKAHFREKLEKEQAERKALEKKLNELTKSAPKPSLDVEDYIDISASLDGLDQREKERLAKEHKLTGRPLKDIRKDEDFVLWQKAYRDKVEKEKQTLTPTTAQAETAPPMTFVEKLKAAKSVDEKEKLFAEAGMASKIRRNPNAGKIKLG